MKKTLITLFLTLGLFCSSYSQPRLEWHNFVPLEARSITADPYRDDLLWVVGAGGLMQYNKFSNSWRSFTTAEGLSKIWCRSIFVDKDVIWVGTETGGANRFDLTIERFTPFLQFPVSPYYPEYHPTVLAIYPETDIVWIGTNIGLFQVERSSLDTLKRFTMTDGLGENYIYSIVDDGQYLWLATAYGGGYIDFPPPTGGLSRLDKTTLAIENSRITEEPYINWFYSLADTGDTLWIAGDRGLMTFDKRTQLFSFVAEGTIQASHAVVSDKKDIWCIGYSTDAQEHLFQVDKQTSKLENLITLPYDHLGGELSVDTTNVYIVKRNRFYKVPKSSLQLEVIPTPFLPSPYSHAITGDNQIMYAGSANQLVIINQDDLSVSMTEVLQNETDLIRGITLDGDILWIGTDNGLFQYNRQTLTLMESYLSSHIVFFTVIDDSWVWASTHLGIYKINKQTGGVTEKDLTSELNTFGTPRISSLVLDGDFVWLSFSGKEIGGGLISGVAKLDRNTLATIQINKFSIGDYTQAIETLIDRGAYLFASGKVISKILKDNLTFETFIDQKASKMVLEDSLLWAIVPDDGIKVFDTETGKELLHLNESNGLLHNWVTDLSLSAKYAWFTTYAGICALELSGSVNVPNEENDKMIPKSFALSENYPNPFNLSTTIEFALPKSNFVRLKVFDLLGKEVAELVAKKLSAGTHKAVWKASEFASGVYFYRLQTGNFVKTRKMVLLK